MKPILFLVLSNFMALFSTVSQATDVTLNLDDYPGGVAVWYLLPEVLTTMEESALAQNHDAVTGHDVYAVHVHARQNKRGKKQIDASFDSITLTSSNLERPIEITTSFAQQHFLSSIQMHTDLDEEKMQQIEHVQSNFNRDLIETEKSIAISRDYCPGGYQIFSFNQSVLWTAPIPEEKGIHVHCFRKDGTLKHDYTYKEVWVECRKLSVESVREYAVQKELFRAGMTPLEPRLESIYAF